jgi:hypothetical protein
MFRRSPRHGYAILAYQVAWAKTFRRWSPRWKRRKRERCPHPPERYYGDVTPDGTHWMGCCLCGAILMVDEEFGARSAERQARLVKERKREERKKTKQSQMVGANGQA